MPKFFILMHGTDVALAKVTVLERYKQINEEELWKTQ